MTRGWLGPRPVAWPRVMLRQNWRDGRNPLPSPGHWQELKHREYRVRTDIISQPPPVTRPLAGTERQRIYRRLELISYLNPLPSPGHWQELKHREYRVRTVIISQPPPITRPLTGTETQRIYRRLELISYLNPLPSPGH